jgi:hypothetical protein
MAEKNDNFYLPATVQQEINAKQDQSSETLNKLINQQKLIISLYNHINPIKIYPRLRYKR